MDNNKYSVDDILEEIKRKKMVKQRIDPDEYYRNIESPEKQEEISVKEQFDHAKEEARQYIPETREFPKVDSFKTAEEPAVRENEIDWEALGLNTKQSSYEPRHAENIVQKRDTFDEPVREEKPQREERPLYRDYTQGNLYEDKVVSEKPSSSIAEAFGNQAFKPYEDKSYDRLKEKHRKMFSSEPEEQPVIKEQKREFSFIEEPQKTYDDKPLEEKIFKEKVTEEAHTEENPVHRKTIEEIYREKVERFSFGEKKESKPKYEHIEIDEPEKVPAQVREPEKEEAAPAKSEKAPFRVNLKDNFFDKDDKENTQMDIPIKNMDSSKAAMGFTRNLPDLGIDEAEKKKKIFSFGISQKERKISPEDYNSPEDKEGIIEDLKKSKMLNWIQFAVTAVIFAVLAYWGFALTNVKMALPSFMLPENNMQMFIGMNLGLLIVNALVCNNIVGGGIISLFTLKPNCDTPASLAVIASIIQGVALTVAPEKVNKLHLSVYFGIASLALLFTLLGKAMMYSRILRNFSFLTSDEEKYTMDLVQDKSFSRELTRGQNIDSPCVAYSSKTKFPTAFLDLSYAEDYSENISKISIPLFLGFSVLVAILTFFFGGDHELMFSLTVFSAMMCICAPLTSALVSNLPLNMISKSLTKDGAMVTGYDSLDEMDEITTLSIDANDLFAGGTIIMHGIKTFSNSRIDNAILDAASVACSSSGILMDIFMEMIQHKTNLLKKVDNVIYEDEMGVSAWVEGKKVLIGNRNLLFNHGITPPDIAYENKFKKEGREVIYLANSGDLTAMFVISYIGSDDMIDYLDMLADKGVSLSVYTTDPNITAEKIESIFDYPQDMITVMGSKNHAEFNEISRDQERNPAAIVHDGSLSAKIRAVCAVINGKSSVVLGTIIQLVTVLLGYGIITFLAFMGKMDIAGFSLLLIYQLLSAAVVTIVPNMKKY